MIIIGRAKFIDEENKQKMLLNKTEEKKIITDRDFRAGDGNFLGFFFLKVEVKFLFVCESFVIFGVVTVIRSERCCQNRVSCHLKFTAHPMAVIMGHAVTGRNPILALAKIAIFRLVSTLLNSDAAARTGEIRSTW
jgi:hypothetical protein